MINLAMVFSFIRTYFMPLLILIAGIIICVQDSQIKHLRETKAKYEMQFEMIKLESATLKNRYEQAHKESETDIKKSIDGVNKILAENVPDDCHAAVKWAINQAKEV